MANIKSQKKRNKTNEKSRQRNVANRSKIKTFVKKAEDALKAKEADEIRKALPKAISEIDRAVSKGVLHRKSAGRKKGSLQRRANATLGS